MDSGRSAHMLDSIGNHEQPSVSHHPPSSMNNEHSDNTNPHKFILISSSLSGSQSQETLVSSRESTKTICMSEHPIHRRPKSPRAFSYPVHDLAYTWRWELFTWLLDSAGFIANIILLVLFDGSRQSQWKSEVQITALVAALAQLSQSALLVPISSSIGQWKWKWLETERQAIDVDQFDQASRGPDGSMRLLYSLKFQPHLVSLGALSTILLLLFPTLVQQSVALKSRQVALPDNGQAYLQRVTVFNNTFKVCSSRGNLDYHDSAAIVRAFLDDFINPLNVTGSCPTNRCTWDNYTILAICARTEDITRELIQNKKHCHDLEPESFSYGRMGLDKQSSGHDVFSHFRGL